jgi:hypothetical protein
VCQIRQVENQTNAHFLFRSGPAPPPRVGIRICLFTSKINKLAGNGVYESAALVTARSTLLNQRSSTIYSRKLRENAVPAGALALVRSPLALRCSQERTRFTH